MGEAVRMMTYLPMGTRQEGRTMAPMKRPAGTRHEVYGETLSVAGAARLLRTTRKAVRQMMSNGQLNFMQVRGHLRVFRRDAEKLAHHPSG